MNTTTASELFAEALLEIVPDADLSTLGPDTDLRDALELDSLDFLSLVERLAQRTGCRIDEEDYDRLRTLRGAADFLAARAA